MRFVRGNQVWARNPFRSDKVYWPAVVVDPGQDVPKDDPVLRKSPDGVCVMFYGPSSKEGRQRDYAFESENALMLWDEQNSDFKAQFMPNDVADKHFQAALDEAEEVEMDVADPVTGALGGYEDQGNDVMRLDQGQCASCGKQTDPQILAGRNGRCKSCQSMFDKGKYCPVCMKVWQANEEGMACCDRCNLWTHFDCDPEAENAQDDNQEYFCPNCRGDGNRSDGAADGAAGSAQGEAMLAEYEARLREMKPPKPRSAFLLFSAEMIRLYRNEGQELDHRELVPIIANAWRNLAEGDRQEYTNAHEEEAAIFQVQNAQYEAIFEEYEILAANNRHEPPVDLLPDHRLHLLPPPGSHANSTHKRPAHRPSQDDDGPARKQFRPMGPPVDLSSLPPELPIVCNGVRGAFILVSQRVACRCKDCARKPAEQREFTPTQFEQHCGAGSAKKWKASLRLEAEVEGEAPGMQIGKWLEMHGIDAKGSRGTGPGETSWGSRR